MHTCTIPCCSRLSTDCNVIHNLWSITRFCRYCSVMLFLRKTLCKSGISVSHTYISMHVCLYETREIKHYLNSLFKSKGTFPCTKNNLLHMSQVDWSLENWKKKVMHLNSHFASHVANIPLWLFNLLQRIRWTKEEK